MKQMKSFLIIFLLCVCYAQGMMSQSLHAIVFCNTLDIGIGCDVDEENILNELAIIAGETNLIYKPYVRHGEDCTKENLQKIINELDCTSDDVVFMYYSGHGAHSAQQMNEPFPQLCMKYDNTGYQSEFISVKAVDGLISRKNPRLSIIITDCCNDTTSSLLPRGLASMDSATKATTNSINALQNLFVKSKGNVKMTGAKLTQSSYGGPNGGDFTNAFIKVLANIEEGASAADWETLAKETRKLTLKRSRNQQEPYAEVNVDMVGTEVSVPSTTPTIQSFVPNSSITPLANHLLYLLDKNIAESSRLNRVPQVLQECFTPGAKVKTIGRNLTTIIAYEEAEDFLRRITASPYIKSLSIVKQSESGKNAEIIVHEIRTR